MTHATGRASHNCRWYNPDGLEVAPPDNIDQWNYRGGTDYWSAKPILSMETSDCEIDPLNCAPVSGWGLGYGVGFLEYCDGAFAGDTDGLGGWTWIILGVVVIAVGMSMGG